MRSLDVLAIVALVCGVRDLLHYAHAYGGRRERRAALQAWEAEGGAVPVSRSATAAQVSPRPDAARPH